jgi:hypothetical protein
MELETQRNIECDEWDTVGSEDAMFSGLKMYFEECSAKLKQQKCWALACRSWRGWPVGNKKFFTALIQNQNKFIKPDDSQLHDAS